MKTVLLVASVKADVAAAVEFLASGHLVAVPTETVYGLAADASNDEAVRSIFAAKGRPTTHPLIVHIADVEHARALSRQWTAAAEILTNRFWPGPLSVLTNRSNRVPSVVTGGRDTVVLRVPDQPVTLTVLDRLHELGSIGLAAPSANRFGSISPTTAQHVISELDGRIEAVLDGGPCKVGIESTIVDCTSEPAVVLRPGGISAEEVAGVLAEHGLTVEYGKDVDGSPEAAIAPGMLRSHYAPRTPLMVFESAAEAAAARDEAASQGRRVAELPHPTDVYLYSRDLYATLRSCDDGQADLIVGVLPASAGLGAAVRDRLLKAAAAR